ncbi:hypothetical protein Hanom_Chr15g01387011 [Helianthus anomalus]
MAPGNFQQIQYTFYASSKPKNGASLHLESGKKATIETTLNKPHMTSLYLPIIFYHIKLHYCSMLHQRWYHLCICL